MGISWQSNVEPGQARKETRAAQRECDSELVEAMREVRQDNPNTVFPPSELKRLAEERLMVV